MQENTLFIYLASWKKEKEVLEKIKRNFEFLFSRKIRTGKIIPRPVTRSLFTGYGILRRRTCNFMAQDWYGVTVSVRT